MAKVVLTTPTIKIGEGEAQPGRIIINGADLTGNIRNICYRATPGHVDEVVLNLAVSDATRIESEHAEVYMDPDIFDLLVRAGWEPPDGDPLRLQAKKLVPSESDGA